MREGVSAVVKESVAMPGPTLVMAITLLAKGRKHTAVVDPTCANQTAAPLPTQSEERMSVLLREQAELVRLQSERIAELERRLGTPETPPKVSTAPSAPPPAVPRQQGASFEELAASEMGAFHTVDEHISNEGRLQTLFSTSTGSPIRALALSRHMVYKGSPQLVAAADAKNNLWIFNRSGELLVTAPLSHTPSASVIALAFGPREDPFVASAGTDGQIRIFNLSLPSRPSRSMVNRIASTTSPPSDESALAALTLDIVCHVHHDNDADGSAPRRSGPPPPIVGIDVYTRRRRTQLLVMDAHGSLFVVGRNGSVHRKLEMGSPVTAFARSGTMIAVATTSDLLVVDISKAETTPLPCEIPKLMGASVDELGFGEITGMAFDLELPQLLYAATSGGEVLLFNTRTRTKFRSGPSDAPPVTKRSSCRLVERLRGHQPSALAIAAVRGYLFSASPSLLVAHNVSGLYSRSKQAAQAVLGRPLGKHTRSKAGATVLAAASPLATVAISSLPPSPPLLALAYGPKGTLTLFSSRLPYDKEKPKWLLNGLFSSPLLMGIAITAVFYSLIKAWRAVAARSAPDMVGYPGMTGSDMTEMSGHYGGKNDENFVRAMAMADTGRPVRGQSLGRLHAKPSGARHQRAHYGTSGMSMRRQFEPAQMDLL